MISSRSWPKPVGPYIHFQLFLPSPPNPQFLREDLKGILMSVLTYQTGLPSDQPRETSSLSSVWEKVLLSLWQGLVSQAAGKSLVMPNLAPPSLGLSWFC